MCDMRRWMTSRLFADITGVNYLRFRTFIGWLHFHLPVTGRPPHQGYYGSMCRSKSYKVINLRSRSICSHARYQKERCYHWYKCWVASKNVDSRPNLINHLMTNFWLVEVVANLLWFMVPASSGAQRLCGGTLRWWQRTILPVCQSPLQS